MPRPKGLPKTGGRKKNTPNKNSGAVKDMILQALSNKGGVKYLEEQADKNSTAFMTLVGRVVPLQVGGDEDNPLLVVTEIALRGVRPDERDRASS